MKFSIMTLTATVAAMTMTTEMALAGPTLRLLPKVAAVGSVSAQQPLRLSIQGAGLVQVSAWNVGLRRRLRVISPSGRVLKSTAVGAQRKFSFSADRAGIYRIDLGLEYPQPIPGGSDGLNNIAPNRCRCGGLSAHKAGVSLLYTTSSAGGASATGPGLVTGGDDTFGGNINPGGSPHNAGQRRKRGQLGARAL